MIVLLPAINSKALCAGMGMLNPRCPVSSPTNLILALIWLDVILQRLILSTTVVVLAGQVYTVAKAFADVELPSFILFYNY